MQVANDDTGPKYFVDTEGTEHPWDSGTITTEQIAQLGGWDPAQGVIEIDKDNNERTLKPAEVIELKPGHGFSKKVKWKRGDDFAKRVDAELEMLRKQYPRLEYDPAGHWIRIPDYALPEGWNLPATDVAFQIPNGYPGTEPYGIYVPAGLQFKGASPTSYTVPASNKPSFPGTWGVFSWAPGDGVWRPTVELHSGPNLLNYARGFADRFREGA